MRLKKTILIWLIGTFAIFIILFYGTFGEWDPSILISPIQYQYDINDIKTTAQLNQLEIDGYSVTAVADDAWFKIKLKRAGKIDYIIIILEETEVTSPAQIYFSNYKEFSSDFYEESDIQLGENRFEFKSSNKTKNLRFDITNKKDEQFKLKKIIVCMSFSKQIEFWIFVPIIIILFLIGSGCYINRRELKAVINRNTLLRSRYELADQILSLGISDFKARFTGSYLGIFWGILQPLSTILLFWFVFQVGFRSQPIDNVPFILWLAAGMIPWNYFYDSWFGGTSAFTSYSYIVKKVVFRIDLLPIVKVLSATLLSSIFNVILIAIYVLYGNFPGFHIFDMLYYNLCLGALTLGLSYLTATLNVFMKDIGQFLGIALQFLMWMTPMMWSYTMIPPSLSWFYKLNPLHYVINGYRESLINNHWFYFQYKEMIWFWIITFTCIICGRKLMKRLKPHFADVL